MSTTAIIVETTQMQGSNTSSGPASEKWCAFDFEFIRSSKEEGQRQKMIVLVMAALHVVPLHTLLD
jgi:hypothetical protein